MQSEDWIDLFRLFPEDQQNKLVLTTMTGIDLNVEIILRTEMTFLVFRGRVSGITDDGRVFFLPYKQIDYLQINRQVKEVEIRELFGDTPDAAALAGRPASGVFAAAQSGSFAAVGIPASANFHGNLPATPATPSAPAPAVPTRGALPGVAARLSTPAAPGAGRPANIPANAMHPNTLVPGRLPTAQPHGGGDGPTPPRNSILERLRAQRNSVVPPHPHGR